MHIIFLLTDSFNKALCQSAAIVSTFCSLCGVSAQSKQSKKTMFTKNSQNECWGCALHTYQVYVQYGRGLQRHFMLKVSQQIKSCNGSKVWIRIFTVFNPGHFLLDIELCIMLAFLYKEVVLQKAH